VWLSLILKGSSLDIEHILWPKGFQVGGVYRPQADLEKRGTLVHSSDKFYALWSFTLWNAYSIEEHGVDIVRLQDRERSMQGMCTW
jgi:hypothetical protein